MARSKAAILGGALLFFGLMIAWPGSAQAHVVELVSVATGGTQANDYSYYPSISSDGRYVAFQSGADDLVPGDTNGVADIFVRDRQAGTTERVSVATDGTQGNGESNVPWISVDGRYVVFPSDASNLVLGDTSHRRDVFVHDRQTGITSRVSVSGTGTQANGASGYPSIRADGREAAILVVAVAGAAAGAGRWWWPPWS